MRFRHTILPVGIALLLMLGAGPWSGAEASIDSARALIDSGDLTEALESLESADSRDAESLFLRGVILAELDREPEAEELFRDLIDRFPDYPEPYNNLAVLLAGNGRFEEAVETLKGALRTHPSYRTAWDNLTTIYGRLASEAYSRALNVESSTQAAPVKLALLGELSSVPAAAMGPVETIPPVVMASASEAEAVQETSEAAGSVTAGESALDASESASESASGDAVEDTSEIEAPIESPMEPMKPVEQSQPQEQAAQSVPESTVPEVEPAEDDAPAIPGIVEQAEPEVFEADPSSADLTALVEAWADAWAGQRPDDYLSYYSSSFVPSDGMPLAEWQELRRARLEAPEFIRVSVALLDYEFDGDEAKVVFNQSYESNTFSDLVTKTLDLEREGGEWKIVRETVGP